MAIFLVMGFSFKMEMLKLYRGLGSQQKNVMKLMRGGKVAEDKQNERLWKRGS